MPGVDQIDEFLAVLDERAATVVSAAIVPPVRRMRVLAEVYPPLMHVREEFLERIDLLAHRVTAVIDQDVDPGDLTNQEPQEFAVGLIPDEYPDAFLLELLAGRIDIDPEYACLRAEIVLPHLQRAALIHAYFQQMNIRAPIAREVAVIYLEVMLPLMNEITRVLDEIGFEIVHANTLRFTIYDLRITIQLNRLHPIVNGK